MTIKIFIKEIAKFFVSLIRLLMKVIGKQIWLFTSWNGNHYSDNPKYLFEHLYRSKQKRVLPVWVSKDVDLVKKLSSKGYKAIHSENKLIRVLLRLTDFIFYSEKADSIYNLSNKNIIHVNLWHGMPIKDIGLLYLSDDIFIVSSETTKYYFEAIHQNKATKFVILGQPKNDGLFLKSTCFDKINSKKHGQIIISYLPTYRGSFSLKSADLRENELPGLLHSLTNPKIFAQVESFLKNNSCILILKPHIRNRITVAESEVIFTFDEFEDDTFGYDSHEIMGASDILITDYSSLVLDFMLLNKPYIFYLDDFEKYKKEQNLIYDIQDLSIGYLAFNLEELFSCILKAKNNLTVESDKLELLKHKFHQYEKDNSERMYKYFLDFKKAQKE